MERAMLESVASLDITGIDLGKGQLARARRKDSAIRIRYLERNAVDTGLPSADFDRVLITLALHEMPHILRLMVLEEAKRLCRTSGQVVGIEHTRPRSLFSRTLLWWFFWTPGNPEVVTFSTQNPKLGASALSQLKVRGWLIVAGVARLRFLSDQPEVWRLQLP